MCNLETNQWKMEIGDRRFLTYIFIWERLDSAGHSYQPQSATELPHYITTNWPQVVPQKERAKVLRQAKIFRPPNSPWEGICVNHKFWFSISHIVYMYQLWVSDEMQYGVTIFWLYLMQFE